MALNQAKIYINAVQLGLAPIGRVSKVSKVRREEVYRIVPRLDEMGLVERVLGALVRVRAVPVEDALSTLLDREKEKRVEEFLSWWE